MNYHLVTLGCQMNRSDSERVRTVIDGLGYRWTDDEAQADLLGVLACSVRQKSIDKVYTRIHRWNEWKQGRNLLTFVSGCMLPADRKKFLKRFDFVFTMNELPELPDMLRQYGVVTPVALAPRPEPPPPAPRADGPGALISPDALRRPRLPNRPVMTGLWQVAASPASAFQAFVPIQNGCDKFCTFCAVPYTRGREVSRPSADILAEVERLLGQGYQTLTLLGQNVNSYGQDRAGAELSFAELLQRVGALCDATGRRVWVYFTSPHPRDMTPEVIDVMAASPSLAKQVHLPLQSGDDKVLLRMNRQHTVGQYRAIVDRIRATLPTATLFTDIIAGFTGETEAQFENTRRVMAEIGFHMAYVAPYSPRPGAASSRWADTVPREDKLRRLAALNATLQETAAAANARLVGQTVPVLVTERDAKRGCLMGLTEGKVHVRLAADEPAWIGKFVDVRLTGTAQLSLAGEAASLAGVR